MDYLNICEIDPQFGQSCDCGSRMAFSGLSITLLMVLDFIACLLKENLAGQPVKPPRANDGRDGRANLADGELRIFPPSPTRGLTTETGSSRN